LVSRPLGLVEVLLTSNSASGENHEVACHLASRLRPMARLPLRVTSRRCDRP
jgi:hypothetical protein